MNSLSLSKLFSHSSQFTLMTLSLTRQFLLYTLSHKTLKLYIDWSLWTQVTFVLSHQSARELVSATLVAALHHCPFQANRTRHELCLILEFYLQLQITDYNIDNTRRQKSCTLEDIYPCTSSEFCGCL